MKLTGTKLKENTAESLLAKEAKDRFCGCGELIPNLRDLTCGKSICGWSLMSDKGKIRLAVKMGVGKQFIRDNKLPSLDVFKEAYKSDLQISRNVIRYEKLSLIKPQTQSTYICGMVGYGKSLLLNIWAIGCISHGYKIEIFNWSRFKREVRSSYQSSATETENDIFKRYNQATVLFLDDLGVGLDENKGRESRAAIEMLYDLIDQRYWNNKPVHITSNLSPEQLADIYDKRIARRITEMCEVVVLAKKLTGA